MNRRASLSRKIRWLSQVIILSGALNVALFAIFFYFLVRKSPFACAFDYAPQTLIPSPVKFSNLEILKSMALLPFEELVEKLENQEEVEEGYKVRDLALSLLVRREHFDVTRALGRKSVSIRPLKIKEKSHLNLFPGLNDEDFSRILTFAKTERWPLTSRGLFLQLSKNKMDIDPSLLQACAQTEEFLLVEMLFKDSKAPIKKKWLLGLLSEGKWDRLFKYAEEQKQGLAISEEKRREFLLGYLREGSQTAASLLLMGDFDHCLKRLVDADVCKILDVLPAKSKRGEQFAKELQAGARGDVVQAKAKLRYTPTGEEIAQIRPPRAAVGALRPVQRDRPPASPSPNEHVIQEGESLARIAKRYGISVESLKTANQLQTNVIRVGKTLKIPH
jgi:hypothetical protein